MWSEKYIAVQCFVSFFSCNGTNSVTNTDRVLGTCISWHFTLWHCRGTETLHWRTLVISIDGMCIWFKGMHKNYQIYWDYAKASYERQPTLLRSWKEIFKIQTNSWRMRKMLHPYYFEFEGGVGIYLDPPLICLIDMHLEMLQLLWQCHNHSYNKTTRAWSHLATTIQFFLCCQHSFWNGLYGYQCYCSHMTTEKNDKKKL